MRGLGYIALKTWLPSLLWTQGKRNDFSSTQLNRLGQDSVHRLSTDDSERRIVTCVDW